MHRAFNSVFWKMHIYKSDMIILGISKRSELPFPQALVPPFWVAALS